MTQSFEQFASLVDRHASSRDISEQEFILWKQYHYTFDALRGISYGQSFCNHFAITDNLLYYGSVFTTVEKCDAYIKKIYLAKS